MKKGAFVEIFWWFSETRTNTYENTVQEVNTKNF
jgi:hypothetical protein